MPSRIFAQLFPPYPPLVGVVVHVMEVLVTNIEHVHSQSPPIRTLSRLNCEIAMGLEAPDYQLMLAFHLLNL